MEDSTICSTRLPGPRPRRVSSGRGRRGRWTSIVPTAHPIQAALTTLCLSSAGYDAADNTAEGFALREEVEFLLARQNREGYFGAADGSGMFRHGLTVLALSEALQASVVADRPEIVRKVSRAARFIGACQRAGVWSALPPGLGGGKPGMIVSALQVMSLALLRTLGTGNSDAAVRWADRAFESSQLKGAASEWDVQSGCGAEQGPSKGQIELMWGHCLAGDHLGHTQLQ